ncbi:MAG TPA: NUDIX hydrolase [Candidatus Saccharimonadales bacterium]|nr:NUDIX hydrolase [Candidatus Saccharimonadales bacterium]
MEALISNTQDVQGEKLRRAAKVAITRSNGDLLILWRSLGDEHRPGGADFPGGGLELRESPVQGALREVWEETAIQLDKSDLHFVGRFTKPLSEPDNPTKEIESTVFRAYVDNPDVQLRRSEHHTYDWIPPLEVQRRGLLAASVSKTACLQAIIFEQAQSA